MTLAQPKLSVAPTFIDVLMNVYVHSKKHADLDCCLTHNTVEDVHHLLRTMIINYELTLKTQTLYGYEVHFHGQIKIMPAVGLGIIHYLESQRHEFEAKMPFYTSIHMLNILSYGRFENNKYFIQLEVEYIPDGKKRYVPRRREFTTLTFYLK